jgi:Na+-transporting methylmalonyl-CoA/oxaloacetate decarboxylase gamma subunit
MTFVFTLLTILIIALILFGKRAVKAFLSETKADVKEVIGLDPLSKAKNQLKDLIERTAQLKAATGSIDSQIRDFKAEKKKWLAAANKAKAVWQKEKKPEAKTDAGLAFMQSQECAESIKELLKDKKANDALFAKCKDQIAKLRLTISKSENAIERNEARKASNTLRRDLARDAALGEGLADLTLEKPCSISLEAEAYEELQGNDNESLLEKYDVNNDSEEFEKFLNS